MSKFFQPTPQQIEAWVAKNFDYKSRKDGNELVICNPFDGDEGYHFNISIQKGTCNDWRGNEWAGPINPRTRRRGCTFINFVKLFLNCTYRQAVQAISLASGSDVPFLGSSRTINGANGRPDAKEMPLVALPTGSEPLENATPSNLTTIILVWLQSRGVTKELCKLHNLHHVGSDVVFPYYEYDTLVYWQTRSAINKVFKFPDERQYGVTKGEFLYNFDNIEPASYVVVTESIFGCYTVGEQCCATGGADMTPMQAKKIKLLVPKDGVILSPDNDTAAIKSIIRNGAMLAAHNLQVYFSLPPRLPYKLNNDTCYTKDWNELHTAVKMPYSEIRKVFENNIMPLNLTTKFKLMSLVNKPKGGSLLDRLG